MQMIRIAGTLLVCTLALAAGIPREEYAARRQAARKAIGAAALVLAGRTEAEMEARGAVSRQEPDFYYLTGWSEPGAVLLLSPASEVLFLPEHNLAQEVYTGPRLAATDKDARSAAGLAEVLPVAQFESRLLKELENHARVLTHTQDAFAARLKNLLPMRELVEADRLIAPLRAAKSQAEIELIEHSTNVSVEAHRAAWRRIAPGLFEYQVAATMSYTMLDRGCEGHAYDPIVGSGRNATVLHYGQNSRRMDQGELVLIDAAASCGAYASDITRTVPVNGKFTPRQRELYDVVLGAYKASLAAVKPGVTMARLTEAAREYMEAHGKDSTGAPLGKYLKHRVAHGVGLEVHDHPTASFTEPLREGMVITIEPGVYIPDENVGIRLEDTVLVTATGARVLGAALPMEAAEIEKAMAK